MSEKSNLRYMFVFEIINIDRSLCGILGLIYGAIMSYVMICGADVAMHGCLILCQVQSM